MLDSAGLSENLSVLAGSSKMAYNNSILGADLAKGAGELLTTMQPVHTIMNSHINIINLLMKQTN